MKCPSSPMSGRRNTTQIVPITFQGMRRGRATRTIVREVAQPPFLGMTRAIPTPSGSSISSTSAENRN